MTILLIKHFFNLQGLLFIFSDNTVLSGRSFQVGLVFCKERHLKTVQILPTPEDKQ